MNSLLENKFHHYEALPLEIKERICFHSGQLPTLQLINHQHLKLSIKNYLKFCFEDFSQIYNTRTFSRVIKCCQEISIKNKKINALSYLINPANVKVLKDLPGSAHFLDRLLTLSAFEEDLLKIISEGFFCKNTIKIIQKNNLINLFNFHIDQLLGLKKDKSISPFFDRFFVKKTTINYFIAKVIYELNKNPLQAKSIQIASAMNDKKALKVTLQTKKTIAEINKAILVASQFGHSTVVKILLNEQADPTVQDNFPISIASQNGFSSVVKVLLKDTRVNPAAQDNTPLKMAVQEGNIKIVQLLLNCPEVDPGADNDFSLRSAVLQGRIEIVQLLLNHPKVNPTANKNYALKEAIRQGNVSIVRYLLDHPKVNPNIGFKLACEGGNFEIIKTLLNSPKNVDASFNEQYPLRMAINQSNKKLVKLLLKRPEVDPSIEDNYAIQSASIKGDSKIVKYLLKHTKVDPSANGNHAIQWASSNGHYRVVKRLLKHPKVDPKANKNFALKEALKNGHFEVAEILKEHISQ